MSALSRLLLVLLSVAPASGCYLRHGFDDAPTVTPPSSGVDAGLRDPRGFDAGTRRRDAGVTVADGGSLTDAAVDVPAECAELCDAWEASGCGSTECLMSCLGRAEQAERIGCLREWKAINDCLRSDPCHAEGCPERSGWPECLARRG